MWSITLALPVFLLAPEATPPESGGTAWLPSKSNFVIDVARVVAIAATTCGLLCHWQTTTTTTTSLSCRHRPVQQQLGIGTALAGCKTFYNIRWYDWVYACPPTQQQQLIDRKYNNSCCCCASSCSVTLSCPP